MNSKRLIQVVFSIFYVHTAVQQEKTQQNLLHGVESFDKSALKPTDTKEKIILPATEGNN